MDGFPILSVMLAVPLVAAVACLFVSAQTARWLALGATLVDLALGRGENRSPGEIGAGAVSLIEAMLRSAARGAAVEVYEPEER